MSDGVTLKADVSYPTNPVTGARAAGKFPVVLTQTPYLGTPATQGDYFVQRGYIFVTAYVRGTTTSGGDFGFFGERDARDGVELVNWASHRLQSSNGKVGLWGGSYGGINQFATLAAAGNNSPIKALAPYCMGAEFYRETYFAGGIPTQTLNFQRVIQDAMGGNTGPKGAAIVEEVLSGGPKAYANEFWDKRTPGDVAQKIADTGVPVLLWSSSGDIYAQSSLELYTYLQNAQSHRPVFGPMWPRQRASGKYQIIMSQGGHCANQDQRITLEWYDTWLKGVKTGVADTGQPLHAHQLISNRWLNTSAYPVVPAYTKYHLGANDTLSRSRPAAKGHDDIAWAQPAADSTLEYTSPAFRRGATLAGPMSASFTASSTTEDLELIATVQLVDVDGVVTPLSSGTVLAGMAANDPSRSWYDKRGVPVRPYGKYDAYRPVPEGSVHRYDFALSPRFVDIPPGSKLRLKVTTQTPTASCTPVLGTDPCFPTAPQAANLQGGTTSLYYGGGKGSTLNLPLLPANCFVTTENPNVNLPYWKGDTRTLRHSPCQR
jgi:predicted acyl esterase